MVLKISNKVKILYFSLCFLYIYIIFKWLIYKKIFPKKSKSRKNIIYKNNTTLIEQRNTHIDSHYVKNSREYWEKRYATGGNSGSGSYNYLAKFKAEIINNFVNKHNINTVIEWGSGDCNQLSYANYKNYIGYDVSQTAINICLKKFKNDSTKKFIHLTNNFVNENKADLTLSLDVIYHLVEDNVFDLYMNNLFNSSNKFVCIYSSNSNIGGWMHVRNRKFTDWIDKYMSNNWKLIDYIPNKYHLKQKNFQETSFADFYFYEKIVS